MKITKQKESKIQFAVPKAMLDGIDGIRRDSRSAGITATRSHVVRCAVAEYLAARGYMDAPDSGLTALCAHRHKGKNNR